MQNLKLSISQLNNYIKSIFDAEELLIGVSVYGEVSNYKISGGNAYFDIKEDGAQLSCIEFGAQTEINNGDSVLVTGRLNYHTRLGKLSFVAQKIEPFGLGELYLKFLALKTKLENEGLFSEEHKKPIPRLAQCVGVVSSETGAVIHDICEVARKKNPYTHIVLYPVKVQGTGAEDEIASGIRALEGIDKVDVIIVARGGGSLEDLAPFNTETVARAVFECKKPIVSGVGHETDFTLCDFASDLRAPTPSVASDVCVFDYFGEKMRIIGILENLLLKIKTKTDINRQNLLYSFENIDSALQNFCKNEQVRIENCADNISAQIGDILSQKTNDLDKLSITLSAHNPLEILKKGYAKVEVNGKPINDLNSVKIDDELSVRVTSGTIISKVIKVKKG